jgi:NhaP-type Na+/H+ or K+/H+ antiporter
MESNVVEIVDNLMRIFAIIIFFGIIITKVSERIPIPDVVLYIGAGILLGPSVLNLIDFSDFAVINQLILEFGAAYILFDGGREISLKVLNETKVTVGLLSTVAVLLSAFITGFFAWKVLHIDFIYALLLGSVIASTDPSVLVPLFKNMNISPKLKQTIISESAFNDAAGAIVTFTVVGIAAGGAFSIGADLLELLVTAGGGVLVGLLIGFLASNLVCMGKLGVCRGLTAEMAIAAVLAAYALAEFIGVSGFMATFSVGLVCGNKAVFKMVPDPNSAEIHESFKGVTISIIRMLIFTLLGVQMNLGIIAEFGGGALIVILAFIFLARPISVLLTVPFDRKAKWNIREIAYLCWTRETGVIPAALAGMLITMGVPNAELISAVTSIAIIITLTFQASTAKYFAKVLKLEVETQS